MTGEASTSPAALLRHQLRYAWTSARGQLTDLSDDEYGWEPASSCWSVRPRAVHHLAEIGALRDLRAGHARTRPQPEG